MVGYEITQTPVRRPISWSSKPDQINIKIKVRPVVRFPFCIFDLSLNLKSKKSWLFLFSLFLFNFRWLIDLIWIFNKSNSAHKTSIYLCRCCRNLKRFCNQTISNSNVTLNHHCSFCTLCCYFILSWFLQQDTTVESAAHPKEVCQWAHWHPTVVWAKFFVDWWNWNWSNWKELGPCVSPWKQS